LLSDCIFNNDCNRGNIEHNKFAADACRPSINVFAKSAKQRRRASFSHPSQLGPHQLSHPFPFIKGTWWVEWNSVISPRHWPMPTATSPWLGPHATT
jgi:hypothetical protein